MSRGYLLIDGPNIGNAVNAAAPLKIGDQPTQAIYGFLRVLRPMISTYSMLTPVVLWDGASWRRMKFAEYKANRDKKNTKAEIEAAKAKDEYKAQVPLIRETLRHLGIKQMMALNYEADDLAGVLIEHSAKEARKAVMISADKDWIQLLRPNAMWIDPVRDYRLSMKTLPERFGWNPHKGRLVVGNGAQIDGFIGIPSPRAYLEMKAIMGDAGDNIPGVGGVGPRGALDLILQYGSVSGFFNQCADKTIDIDALPKKIRDFATSDEKQEFYRRNMRLMDLRSKERPAWVNPKIDKGEFDPEKFRTLCDRLAFNSIASNLDAWLEPFNPREMELAA